MVLGQCPVPGRLTDWMIEGQGPIVFAVEAGGGRLDVFTLLYLCSPLSLYISLFLWGGWSGGAMGLGILEIKIR